MNNLFSVCAVAVFAAIIAVYLRKNNPELTLVFSLSVVIFLILTIAESIFPIMDKLGSYAVADELFFSVPFKILGLTLLGKITTSVCDDAGEKGISTAVSLIVRISAILIALPLFDKLLEEIGTVLAL